MHIIELRRLLGCALLLGFCATGAAGIAFGSTDGKIPITTRSEEARQLYLKGRSLADTLRVTDARRFYQEAVAKDPGFARAYLDLANTAGTAKEFFEAVKQAVAAADKVSEPERLMILGLDAGTKGDVAGQKAFYSRLVEGFPHDERALVLLGTFYFGQQDYAAAIKEYDKARAVAPSFSQIYNQLGYAYRFLGKYAEAEQAFRKYIELIPNDPNPYDSNAELLMKMGRFEDSIASYEKALTFDRNFVASYVGIGNDQLFLGHGDAARASYARLTSVARTNAERRTAIFWSVQSYVDEGSTALALAEIEKMSAFARADGDVAALSADSNLAGNILLEAGEADKAAVKFAEGMASIEKADVPAEVKQAARRTDLYDGARVALVKGDLKGAHAKADEYARQVAAAKSIPFEVRRQHELAGRLALADKEYGTALAELAQASQQDPRVLFLTAIASQGKGDTAEARAMCQRTADFNELNPNYAYVRAKAKAMLAKL